MPINNENKLSELALLQEKFASNLEGRIADITSFSQRLGDVSNKNEHDILLASLQSSAHKLSGSAGSYGFPEVSRICKQIDIVIKEYDDDIQMMPKNRIDELKNLMVQLKKEGVTVAMNNQIVKAGALILVVDDDPDICALVQLTLQHEGYEVLTTQTGKEGLEAFRENSNTIKLALLDIALPGVSGVDVLAQFKEIEPSIPVIFMSAYIEDKSEASSFGAIDAITKPFNLEDLKRQVSNALSEK